MSLLESLVGNRLPEGIERRPFTAILGDQPSRYAKSPGIWNAVFASLGAAATYIPLDVPAGALGKVVTTLRDNPNYLGGNVTVPYKVEVMQHLDRIDPLAAAIGAVNTIARAEDGLLHGYNTDGQGGLEALTASQPGPAAPFMPTLDGARVVLLGAGGAACAMAFCLARELGGGRLWIANRSPRAAAELASRLRDSARVETLAIEDLDRVIGETTLLVNATTVGQSGLRPLPDGGRTILEPYAPLASVRSESLPGDGPEALRVWGRAAAAGIGTNNQRSMELLARMPVTSGVFDLIYSPLETTLLRLARLSGHPTLNGKTLNICQAAIAFLKVMGRRLPAIPAATDEAALRDVVLREMNRVW